MNADPRPLFARAAEQATALIETVRTDELDGPTPCAEYDVRMLLSHLAGATVRLAVAGEGGDATDVPPVDGVPDDGWTAAYNEVSARAVRAWAGDDDRLDAVVRLSFGEMPGRAAVSVFVMETVAHTWDLSEALGRPRELDPELAEFALTVAHRIMPAEQRGDDLPFGSAEAVPADAGAYDKLAAWLGRKPLTRA